MRKDDTNNHELDEELVSVLKDLVTKYEKEDSWIRKQQVKMWKKNEKYWHGIQYIFWSESRQDWTSPTAYQFFDSAEDIGENGGPFYDFVINIYKAHGEAIIAALGASTPVVRFPPDDADDDDDLQTSKTFSKISDLIDRHNQVKALQMMSLFFLWNQGIVFWYHAPKADKAFGMTKVENFKKQLTCTACEESAPVDDEEDLLNGIHNCPKCGGPMEVMTVADDVQESPKTRVIIEAWGGLHVKVSYYARELKDSAFLIKSLDQSKEFLKSVYPHIADKIQNEDSDAQQFEKAARSPSSFSSFSRADEKNLATHKQIWMRPYVLEGLPPEKEEEKKKLQKLFPNGIYVCMIGSQYVESRDEDLDKYWSCAKAGLSTYIHADALGQPLISVQELRNTLVNLTAETIEQGMSSGFADPNVLDFNVYSKHEARPGMIYPAKAAPGNNLAQGFHETGRATLSKEVGVFGQQLDKDAQFVVGSFPSLYGGPGEGKSRTLGEYQQSRQMALQRLSIAWSLFCIAWAKLKEKTVHMYVENMVEDDKFVTPDPTKRGNYVNVWIRKADLSGHVGEVEPEGADMFPVSMPQKQGLFFKLLEMNNEFINAALFDPENRRMIADLSGFTDLEIPGEAQRIKQSCEISDLIKGMQVSIDPLVDDNELHIATCKNFCVSPIGLDLRKTNPMAYMKIEEHIQAHAQQIQMAMQQQMAMQNVMGNKEQVQ